MAYDRRGQHVFLGLMTLFCPFPLQDSVTAIPFIAVQASASSLVRSVAEV